jgi:predicted SAM-dependent methyltransferase
MVWRYAGMIKLNICCGYDIKPKSEGWINIDFIEYEGVDLVLDLNDCKTLPFEDNSIDEIYCSHGMEHLINPIDFVMECYRILKTNGGFIVKLPSFSPILLHLRYMHTKNYMNDVCRDMNKNRGIGLQHGNYFKKISVSHDKINLKHFIWNIYIILKCLMCNEYVYKLKK